MRKLSVLMLAKYPPIAGGESVKAYWLARGLAERGHSVYVVSNCQEVEAEYRCRLNPEDAKWLQPSGVRLYSTDPFDTPQCIPATNAYCERLTCLALDVMSRHSVDIVMGWYLVPYGVAAYAASRMTGKKLLLQHAGSDMAKFYGSPSFHRVLSRIIAGADAIWAYPSMARFFEDHGARRAYIHAPAVHPSFSPFRTDGEMPAAAVEVGRNNTLLFLGKMSPGKGLELLLDAFASLGRGDHQLLAVGSGRLRDAFERDASARGLDNVHINTHLPTWEIPCLLRNVRAVVVPECGFSVTEHYSRVPQEAWACGCTAVVSNRRTAPPRDSAGMVYVDPCNTAAFASALKQLLSTPSPPLGEQDKELRASITAQQYGAYIDRAEQMLAEITAAGEEAG